MSIDRTLVREYNGLREQAKTMERKLERMEAHEGDDGTPEDVAGQCALVDELATVRRRIVELRGQIYPQA